MTNIVVDKSTDNAEPLSICFLPHYSTPEKVFISERDQNHEKKKEQAYDWFIPKMGVPDWLLHCVKKIDASMTRTALSRLLSTTAN